MKIYVGQLPFDVKETDLAELLSAYGEVASANLIIDRYSGRPKGYGFVEMPNNAEADQAIKALNKTMFRGREIKVNQVQPNKRNKNSRRRSRY